MSLSGLRAVTLVHLWLPHFTSAQASVHSFGEHLKIGNVHETLVLLHSQVCCYLSFSFCVCLEIIDVQVHHIFPTFALVCHGFLVCRCIEHFLSKHAKLLRGDLKIQCEVRPRSPEGLNTTGIMAEGSSSRGTIDCDASKILKSSPPAVPLTKLDVPSSGIILGGKGARRLLGLGEK